MSHRTVLLAAALSFIVIGCSHGAVAAVGVPSPALPDPNHQWADALVFWSDFSTSNRPLDPATEALFCSHAEDAEGNDLVTCDLWAYPIHLDVAVAGELQVQGHNVGKPAIESDVGIYHELNSLWLDTFIGQIEYRDVPNADGSYPGHINGGAVLATVNV